MQRSRAPSGICWSGRTRCSSPMSPAGNGPPPRRSAVSSTPFGEPLDLSIRPSRLIATLLIGMHLVALVVSAGLPLPVDYRAALLLAILSAFFWNVAVYVQR